MLTKPAATTLAWKRAMTSAGMSTGGSARGVRRGLPDDDLDGLRRHLDAQRRQVKGQGSRAIGRGDTEFHAALAPRDAQTRSYVRSAMKTDVRQ